MKENSIRPDIRVDRETWKRVKAYSIMSDVPMGQIVLDALQLWVEVYASNSSKYAELVDAVRNRKVSPNEDRPLPDTRRLQ